jgi:hypothetical protein
MSIYGGQFNGQKDDIYYAMRGWLETKTDCDTRTEVFKHIADCFMEACDTAAFLDKEEHNKTLLEVKKLRREIKYYGMYMNRDAEHDMRQAMEEGAINE